MEVTYQKQESGSAVEDSTRWRASVSESESANIERDAHGLVQHLGADLPDADGYTSANEQVSAQRQLLSESVAPIEPAAFQPERKGKLKRVSLPTVGGARPRLRRLGKTTVPRLDPYALADSPEKPRYPLTGRLAQPSQPSPTRKQKQFMKADKLNGIKPTGSSSSTQPAGSKQLGVPLDYAAQNLFRQSPRRSPRKAKLDSDEGNVQSQHTKGKAVRYQDSEEDEQSSSLQGRGNTACNELFCTPEQPSIREVQTFSQDRRQDRRRDSRPAETARSSKIALDTQDWIEEQANAGAHDPGRIGEDAELPQASEGEHSDGDAISDASEAKTPLKSKINFPRPSEILPREAPNRHRESDSEQEIGIEQGKASKYARARRKRSRATAFLASEHTEKQKRPQNENLFDSTEIWTQPTEQVSDAPGGPKLLGEWDELQTIFRNVNKVGVREVDLDDRDAIALQKCVKKARRAFKRIQEGSTAQHEQSDPLHYFAEIQCRVDGLCGQDENFPTDFDDLTKSRNIYYHVIPRILVRALKDMVEHYDMMDQEEDMGCCSVTLPHLLIISKFIELILQMGKGAKNYVRPESSYALVKPVEQKLLLPLRVVNATFTGHLREVEEAEAELDRRKQAQEEEALRRDREQEEEERKAKHDAELKKWQDLHSQRRVVERGILSARKQRHLRFPDPSQAAAEYDHGGNTFERITAIPRVGPLHADVVQAKYEISRWPSKAVVALELGLKRHTGPLVFEKIFREHCGKGGVLNAYNVTQIVVMAATMKVRFAMILLKQTGMVEDWVEQIPVWTKIRPLDVLPDFATDETGRPLAWDEELLERLEMYGARSI